MVTETSGVCCINGCTRPATHEEIGVSQHWRFIVHYCAEHAREIHNGIPVGPAGLDPCRLTIHSRGTEEVQVGGILPSIGPG